MKAKLGPAAATTATAHKIAVIVCTMVKNRSHVFRPQWRYDRSMTGLLEQAIRRAESLSAERQDVIASQIIESIEKEESWVHRFGDHSVALSALACQERNERELQWLAANRHRFRGQWIAIQGVTLEVTATNGRNTAKGRKIEADVIATVMELYCFLQ
jgi:hypothetical protein